MLGLWRRAYLSDDANQGDNVGMRDFFHVLDFFEKSQLQRPGRLQT